MKLTDAERRDWNQVPEEMKFHPGIPLTLTKAQLRKDVKFLRNHLTGEKEKERKQHLGEVWVWKYRFYEATKNWGLHGHMGKDNAHEDRHEETYKDAPTTQGMIDQLNAVL